MQTSQACRTAPATFGMLVALVFACVAPRLHAQATDAVRNMSRTHGADSLRAADSVRKVSPVVARLRYIPDGAELRIAAGRARLEGRLVRGTIDSVALRALGRTHTIAAADVDTIWRRRNRGRTGARVGAGIGALGMGLVVAVGSGLGAGATPAEHGRDSYPGLVFGVLAGGLAGAFVGALAGSAVPRWERVVP